jgi:hypothetical protein
MGVLGFEEFRPWDIPGLVTHNNGWLWCGETGTWIGAAPPDHHFAHHHLLTVVVDDAGTAVRPPRPARTPTRGCADPRVWRRRDGSTGVIWAAIDRQDGTRIRWGQAWGTMTPRGDIEFLGGFPESEYPRGHKNLIPHGDVIIDYPARGTIRRGLTSPAEVVSPPLDFDLRGGTPLIELPGTPWALAGYHDVIPGASGRLFYRAWIGLVAATPPHGVAAVWEVDTTWIIDRYPEVRFFPLRNVESVVFPTSAAMTPHGFELVCGVQDGWMARLIFDPAPLLAAAAALPLSPPVVDSEVGSHSLPGETIHG